MTSEPAGRDTVERILRGLEHAPRYRGLSFRGRPDDAGFGASSPTLVTELLTPTSRDLRVATENFTVASAYAVIGGAGRSVEQLSRHPEQREVVFLPVTMFRPVETIDVGGFEILLVEQLGVAEEDRAGGQWTLERIREVLPAAYARARELGPVAVSAPGKFLGDIR